MACALREGDPYRVLITGNKFVESSAKETEIHFKFGSPTSNVHFIQQKREFLYFYNSLFLQCFLGLQEVQLDNFGHLTKRLNTPGLDDVCA